MSTLEQRVIDLGKQRDQFERESKAWRELAESRLKEVYALAAYQKEMVRELQSCQNVLYMMAHHGQVTWAYSKDARAVLDKKPEASLADHDAEVVKKFAESLVEVGNVPHVTDGGETDSYFECGDILQYAENYAKRIKDGEWWNKNT